MKPQVSFIVIGKNAEATLNSCLSELVLIQNELKITSEIIYVDSDSNDASVLIASNFPSVLIVGLKGECNAALARNAGASFSKGQVLGFIDSDMIVERNFIQSIFRVDGELTSPFVSGNWINVDLNTNERALQFAMDESRYESVTGGLFFVKRELWFDLNGMDPRFIKAEDLDFGLRASKLGFKLHRLNEIAVSHFTIPYTDSTRLYKELKYNLYSKSLLYRKHLLNVHVYKHLIRHDYSLLAFYFSLASLVCFGPFGLVISFAVYLVRSRLSMRMLLYYVCRDVLVSIGFLFFWPKRPSAEASVIRN